MTQFLCKGKRSRTFGSDVIRSEVREFIAENRGCYSGDACGNQGCPNLASDRFSLAFIDLEREKDYEGRVGFYFCGNSCLDITTERIGLNKIVPSTECMATLTALRNATLSDRIRSWWR